jgi:hypothetical protein
MSNKDGIGGNSGYSRRAVVQPRLIRLRDAPAFFGMDKNRFNRDVRPHLTEIIIGKQGRAFDRLEMEAAAEDYKSRNGRPAAERSRPWDETRRRGSSNVVGCGRSTKSSEEEEFAKALELAMPNSPRSISHGVSTKSEKQLSLELGQSTPSVPPQRST